MDKPTGDPQLNLTDTQTHTHIALYWIGPQSRISKEILKFGPFNTQDSHPFLPTLCFHFVLKSEQFPSKVNYWLCTNYLD